MSSSSRQFLVILAVGLVVTIGFAVWFRGVIRPPEAGLEVGKELPPIRAAGWINGPPPTADELRGRVIVLDAWATWCGVCRQQAPEHVELYHKYRDQGVVFLGLTDEGEDQLPAIQEFIETTGIPWPNGYGAAETIEQLGAAHWRPGVWVIGTDGRVLWNYGRSEPLEDALRRALDEQGR